MTRPNPSEKDSTVAPNQSKGRGRVLCDSSGLVSETLHNKVFVFRVVWCIAAFKALAYWSQFANVMRILLNTALGINTSNLSVTMKNCKAT